jgi:hypothetical protein
VAVALQRGLVKLECRRDDVPRVLDNLKRTLLELLVGDKDTAYIVVSLERPVKDTGRERAAREAGLRPILEKGRRG